MVYASPIDEYELARASGPPIEKMSRFNACLRSHGIGRDVRLLHCGQCTSGVGQIHDREPVQPEGFLAPSIVEDGATMSRVAVPVQSSDRRRTIGGSPKGHSRLSRGKVSVIDRRADDFRASC
jgi:hypothetical protein